MAVPGRVADVVRTLVVLIVLACACALRAEAQGHIPAGYEEGLFDVTAPGLPQQSVPVLVTPRGKFLLPVRTILDPLGVPYRVETDSGVLRVTRPAGIGTASAWWVGARRLEVKTAAPLDSDDVYIDGPAVFLAATRFAELIEATVDVDVGTLTITLRREGGFPAQIKLDARERRREEALHALASETELPAGSVPFRPRTGAGVVEWGFGGPLHRTSAPSTLDLRGGMGLQGGMLQVHGTAVVGATDGGSNLLDREITYRRVFPGQRWVQQLQLGSVISDGAEARPIQGITLTNAPFVRGIHFDEVVFSRPLPPGWDALQRRRRSRCRAGFAGPSAAPERPGGR